MRVDPRGRRRLPGVSAAIAVTKAGYRATIMERAGELREIGAALSIWPNALAALDYLGVGDQVREVGAEAPTASIRSTSGASIVRFDTDAMRLALGGLPVVVLRTRLHAALYAECDRLGVEIRLGHAVEKVREVGRQANHQPHIRPPATAPPPARPNPAGRRRRPCHDSRSRPGACQALEDAAVLLACAKAHPAAGPSSLFESFERTRLRRVRLMVRDSYRIGRLATAPWRLAAGSRDLLTRLVPEGVYNRRLAVYASATAFAHQLDTAAG